MAFVWISKSSGQRARGGGCIGCLPFGCLTAIPLVLGGLIAFLAV